MNTNPFEIPQSSDLATAHIRRQDLPTLVRKYADNLAAQIREVYVKYGAKNFEELKVNKKLSAQDARKVADLLKAFKEAVERKGEFRLGDIPTFSELPSNDSLKNKQTGFKFDNVWEEEYRAGRPLSDFALTDQDLQDIGFDDQTKREELLQELAKAKEQKEPGLMAPVFDIGDVIARKKQENPDHPPYLSIKEILEAVDEDGYRPATLEESLAFAKDNWKPEADLETLTDEERLLQHINARCVHVLASPFTRSTGARHTPCLSWFRGMRRLVSGGPGRQWESDDYFLVIRKSRRSRAT